MKKHRTVPLSPQALRQKGFSLLEVLVAFSIMALVLGVLYQLAGGSTRGVAYLEQRAYAVVMAESLLARYNSIPSAGVRESGGNAGDLQWQLNSRPFPRSAPPELSGDGVEPWVFHQLEARIVWHDRGRERSVSLHTLLPEQDVGMDDHAE